MALKPTSDGTCGGSLKTTFAFNAADRLRSNGRRPDRRLWNEIIKGVNVDPARILPVAVESIAVGPGSVLGR